MTREVKNFLLSVTPIDPTPLLGGFLPFPLDRLLRKRCLDYYEREIAVLRNEIVVIMNRAVWFKMELGKEASSIYSSLPSKNKFATNLAGDEVKISSTSIGSPLLDIPIPKAAAQMEHKDKDAVHCDRLKRFKAADST